MILTIQAKTFILMMMVRCAKKRCLMSEMNDDYHLLLLREYYGMQLFVLMY